LDDIRAQEIPLVYGMLTYSEKKLKTLTKRNKANKWYAP